MLSIAYSFSIWIYKYLVTLVAPFNTKAKLRVRGLKSQTKEIDPALKTISDNRILIHCSSLGEYEQARPIIRKILTNTDLDIVVSFFSPSGYDDAQLDNELRTIKCYLPFDRESSMNKFLNLVNPEKVIIIKNEWWWNMLSTLNRRKIPTYLASSTIRKDHYFIKYPFPFFKKRLDAFTRIFCVDQSSADHLKSVYMGKVIISGDTRLDQVLDIKQKQSKIKSSVPTIIYGSIWISDFPIIRKMIELRPDAKHVLYPHNLDDQNIANITRELHNVEIVHNIDESNTSGTFINNSMGSLKRDYSQAHLAYVGGGFGEGIHNILEAVIYEIPTVIGPKYNKSLEAIELISKNCLFSVKEAKDVEWLLENFKNHTFLNRIETSLKTYFSESNSATELIFSSIFKQSSTSK